MYTSYFAKWSNCIPLTFHSLVSIAKKAPSGYVGEYYPLLYPPWPLVQAYKQNGDEGRYKGAYYHMVLKDLDPQKVFDEIGEKSILLCWEGPGKFCHRRLVAEWFQNELGVLVPEFP